MSERGARSWRLDSWRRRIFFALAVLIALACGAYLLRARIAASALKQAAERAGIALTWKHFELEGLSSVRVEGLSVQRTPDLDLRADSIAIDFDAYELARHGAAGIESVRVRGLALDAGPFASEETPSTQAGPPFEWPASIPLVDVDIAHAIWRLSAAQRIELASAHVHVDASRAECTAAEAAWIDGDFELAHPLALEARYEGGRFTVERASFDPRLVLEHASADLTRVARSRAEFEARGRVLDSVVDLSGNVADEIVDVRARVSGLDVAAVEAAFVPNLGVALAAHADLTLEARLPWNSPAQWSGRADVTARDVRFLDRELDFVSARIAATPARLVLEDGFVVHGVNAIHVEGSCPRPPFDPCAWLDGTNAWAEADIADLAAFLRDDIGLASANDDPPVTEPSRVSVEATLFGPTLAGRVRGQELSAARVLALFDAEVDVDARVDLDARVRWPLHAPELIAVDADLDAQQLELRGRHADAAHAHAELEGGTLSIQDAFVAQGANVLEIPYASSPLIPFDVCAPRERALVQMQLDCADLPALLHAEGSEIPGLDRLPEHHLELRLNFDQGALDLERGEFTAAGSRLHVERGRVPIHDDWKSTLTDEGLDIALGLRFDDIANVLSIAAPDAFEDGALPHGFVAGRARLRGGAHGPSGHLGLRAHAIETRAATIEDVIVDMDIDERSLRVTQLDARSSQGVLSGAGTYEFTTRTFVGVRLDADFEGLERIAPGWLPSGSVQAHAYVDGRLAAIDGSIQLEARDLSWRGQNIHDVELDASARAGAVRIEQFAAAYAGFETRLSGSLLPADPRTPGRRFILETFELGRGTLKSELTRPATIDVARNEWAVRDFALAGSLGTLGADVSFAHAIGCADVNFAGQLPRALVGDVAEFLPEGARVDLSLSASYENSELGIETRGRIDAPPVPARDAPAVSLRWDAHLADRRATIDEFVLETPDAERSAHAVIKGSFPLDPLGPELLSTGTLALHVAGELDQIGWLPLPPRLAGSTGSVNVVSELSGDWSSLRGSFDVTAASIVVPTSNPALNAGPSALEAHVVLADTVRIDAAQLVLGDAGRVRAAGTLGSPLDVRALVRGGTGSILDAPLDFAVELDAADLAPIAAHVPAIRRTGGRVTASARATGTLRAPHVEGTAQLDDGEIRTATNLPGIVGVSSRVHFDGQKLVVDALTGEMGGAPFSMHGELSLVEAEPRLDLALDGSSFLLWRQGDVSVRADADLELHGPLSALVLSGNLALRDGRYTKKLDFLAFGKRGPATAKQRGLRLFALDEAPFSTMSFDVKVTSATPFAIANNVLRARLVPDLVLTGTGALPELHGAVLVEPSRVLLPSGTMRVRSGRIEFRADQPDVPVLDLQASARFQGYDIEVNISGDYDNPRVDLSSVPPLSREDLALLLITGRPPGNGLSLATGQRAAVDVAVYIARDAAAAWLAGDEDSGEQLAERLEVVIGADTTRSGVDAILVRLRLSGDPTRHKVGWYVTGERDIYDFYNFGLRCVFSVQ